MFWLKRTLVKRLDKIAFANDKTQLTFHDFQMTYIIGSELIGKVIKEPLSFDLYFYSLYILLWTLLVIDW